MADIDIEETAEELFEDKGPEDSNGDLPEAPVSITVRGYYKGFSVLITKRNAGSKVELENVVKAIDNMVGKGFKPSWKDEPVKTDKDPDWITETTVKAPSCPECGGEMVQRTAKKTGNKFWGCSHYPECDGTIWPKKG